MNQSDSARAPDAQDVQGKIVLDAAIISRDLSNRLAQFSALREEADFIVRGEISKSSIKTHLIESRVKELASILRKAEIDRKPNPLDELTDIVGLRIICLFKSDLKRIDEILRNAFVIVEFDDRVSGSSDTFGYMSHHYLARMKPEYSGPRYESINAIVFEIQVRTLCMHAWAAVSHHLDYKGDWDVPADLKKSLNALSALFYVADDQFELFSNARATFLSAIAESSKPDRLDQEINFDTLDAYLKEKYPDNEHSDARSISEFVRELAQAGIRDLRTLDVLLNSSEEAYARYKKARYPRKSFFDVGVARLSLGIVSAKYREAKYPGDDDFTPFEPFIKQPKQ